jgi:3-dehydroquinate dehydratase type I
MNDDNRYCLPIQRTSLTEAAAIIESARDKYGYFELWLDFIQDLSFRDLEDFLTVYERKLVVLFRRPNLQEIQLTRDARDRVIEMLGERDIYIDIDIATQEEDLAQVLELRKAPKIIISYHNYNYTPSDDEIERILLRMEQARAHTHKLSTFCRTECDGLRLLHWCLNLRKEGKSYIILGMGEHGLITRVFANLWGNSLIFAPEQLSEASAPGQLSHSALQQIFAALEDRA